MEILEFLWAVINNWAGYITGGLIVALVSFYFISADKPMPRNIGFVLAALFLFMAFFKAWRDQKHAKEKAQEELNAEADIRGVVTVQQTTWQRISPAPGLPAIETPTYLFSFDYSNHGRKPCQITKTLVTVTLEDNQLSSEIIPMEGRWAPIAHGEGSLRCQTIPFPSVPPGHANDVKMKIALVDALGIQHQRVDVRLLIN